MKLELALRWSEEPLGAPAAWLLPGIQSSRHTPCAVRLPLSPLRDSADGTRSVPATFRTQELNPIWLTDLSHWGVAQASLRLLLVARRDGGPIAGLLILPPKDTAPAAGTRGIPYRLLAGRLYLPLDARLEPEVTERELSALLPGNDTVCVWHPILGLLAYGPEDLRRVEDLLERPPQHTASWDRAVPGPAINRRLVSIAPAATLSLEQMLAEARGDIGSQASARSELPPRPEEEDWGKSTREGLAAGAARMVDWMTRWAEGSGRSGAASSTPGWLDAIRNWAARQQQAWAEHLAAARNRELLRLLDMLKKRPDEGLRFALPLAGDASRGIAPPGASLGARNVDFSLSGLGGGQAADYWDIEERYRRELTERYRELANREISLGRHRRAAYIFAELLGDLRAAASTLEDGKHYREAAALYQERLASERDAARCLCRGGLWVEAIAIYQKLGEHEQVGDLYVQLEDHPQASQAFQAAVDARRAVNDTLGAARILEGKLLDPDGAYRELVSAWPAGPQAEACLERAFELLGARGRHDEACRQIAALPETVAGWGRGGARMLVERLAGVAVKYPDAEARRAAADQTRVAAAARFEVGSMEEIPPLAAALRTLAAGDRLLARDCQRFLESRQRKSVQSGAPAFHRPHREIILVRQFQLGDVPFDLQNIVALGKTYFAVGRTPAEPRLCFVRGEWDGSHREVVKRTAGPTAEVLLAVCQRPPVLYAHSLDVAVLDFDFTASPCEHGDIRRVTSHSSFDPRTVAIAAQGGRLVSIYAGKDNDLVVVNTFLVPEGKLASSRTIFVENAESQEPLSAPLVHLLRGDALFLGFGNSLAIDLAGRTERIEFDEPIRSIVGSLPHTRDRIAIMLEDRGVMLWGQRATSRQENFAQGLSEARAGFTEGGWLVAASSSEIQAYHTSHGHTDRLTWLASAPGPGEEVVGVWGTDQPNEAAVATAKGEIRIYRLPKP